MDQDLRKAFEEFKFYTLECITSLQNDGYDVLDNLLIKRQEILDSISKMNCSVEDCRSIANELDILSLQKMFSELILEKRKGLKGKIDSIERNKAATHSYNRTFSRAIIFSKKI